MEEVRHAPSYWETGTVNTLLDHNDWGGEIRGQMLFKFCERNNLVITNIWFRKLMRI